jgi:predicted AlkP superfamily phosphohydrolase/phosphomutase
MPTKVLILAFDALETELLDRWIAEGAMPTFADLGGRGITYPLDNTVYYLPDTIWSELITGRSAPAAGVYWQPEQVHAGEARLRANTPEDSDLTPFWCHASEADRKVAVIDAVYAPPAPGLNGVLLRDWGTHSAGFGRGSDPPDYLAHVVARYDDYPFPHGWSEAEGRSWGCDIHDGSRTALEQLPQKLADAVDLKTRVVLGELERGNWDLFFASFHESHCAGHQLWHFMDEASPWYEADAPASLKNGMRDVYARLDRSLGQILERVDRETEVLVVLSRGMTSHVGGWQLLPEILVRLGYSAAGPTAASVRSRLPAPVRRVLKAVVRGPLRERLKSASGTPTQPLEHPRTKAMWVRCGGNGAIRLNVQGRDPFGAIEPGEEYDAVCEDLKRELEALRDTESGEPVVIEVLRSDAVFGDRHHPNLPDLIVKFRKRAAITSVTSPRIGTVSEPARTRHFPRSGEHTDHARLWHLGPGISGGRTVDGGHVFDLSATVLDLLSVPLPGDLDGKPLPLGGRGVRLSPTKAP